MTLKKKKQNSETNPPVIAMDLERFPYSSCLSLAMLCPGRKVRRPLGGSSRKAFRSSFGSGSWHVKAMASPSHALGFFFFDVSSGSALLL